LREILTICDFWGAKDRIVSLLYYLVSLLRSSITL
jgi:hypothetical protein